MPRFFIHYGLKHRAEDSGRYSTPIKLSRIKHGLAHFTTKGWYKKWRSFFKVPIKETAIHIRQGCEIFIQGSLPTLCRHIENLEYFTERAAKITPILSGTELNVTPKRIFGENAGIIGEKTKNEAY